MTQPLPPIGIIGVACVMIRGIICWHGKLPLDGFTEVREVNVLAANNFDPKHILEGQGVLLSVVPFDPVFPSKAADAVNCPAATATSLEGPTSSKSSLEQLPDDQSLAKRVSLSAFETPSLAT
eukprot:CAMPEP_0172895762 /NCGR_PEP_ID=MMETSP1075-20121228/153850_1 /TAXON_ID=2916 /ORGANISM="Ceratium fusus, Strain PA161109" /LENGTH=122 /DNA_ID=CAMNT_0013751035 /DNA_START=95 /DNA_END=459 /DNA_ORIENTATION=+